MNQSRKRPSPPTDATSASSPSKKPKILTTPSGIALPQSDWFDPWNSSATGHQRAENNLAGSKSWRESRNLKLGAQYQGGRNGGERVADTVGAGSENFGNDGRKVNGDWRKGSKGLRAKGQRSLFDCVQGKDAWKTKDGSVGSPDMELETSLPKHGSENEELRKAIAASLLEPNAHGRGREALSAEVEEQNLVRGSEDDVDDDLKKAIAASIQDQCLQSPSMSTQSDWDKIPPSYQPEHYSHTVPENAEGGDAVHVPKQIFRGLVFYINGSTAPLVSDHKLKYLISSHGGSLSISHMRKAVTHVILGNPHNHRVKGGGAGGALAGTKINKEIVRTRGKGVKFVSVEWVLDSIKEGKRVSEANYENVKVGGAGQSSVFNKFRTRKPGMAGQSKKDEDMNDEELGIV